MNRPVPSLDAALAAGLLVLIGALAAVLMCWVFLAGYFFGSVLVWLWG